MLKSYKICVCEHVYTLQSFLSAKPNKVEKAVGCKLQIHKQTGQSILLFQQASSVSVCYSVLIKVDMCYASRVLMFNLRKGMVSFDNPFVASG